MLSYLVKVSCVGGGGRFHLVECEPLQFRDLRGDKGQVSAFVALSPVRHGGEIGGVGFQDDMLEGNAADGLREGGLLEGDDTADAHEEIPAPPGPFIDFETAREAMQDAS